MPPKKTSFRLYLVVIVLLLVAGASIHYAFRSRDSFCFNFVHDMQFGDRAVAKPFNQGVPLGGTTYYLPEVPALQSALAKQGFYVDPYESTGGGVYAAAFFGPSTKSAVAAFQKKAGLSQTGEVNNDTLDRLSALYSCPKTATSTVSVASTTVQAK